MPKRIPRSLMYTELETSLFMCKGKTCILWMMVAATPTHKFLNQAVPMFSVLLAM